MLGILVTAVTFLPPIVPRPEVYESKTGEFRWAHTVSVEGDRRLFATRFLVDYLQKGGANVTKGRMSPVVRLELDSASPQGPEGYTLDVEKNQIKIVGGGPSGLLYGVMSLRQLLPVQLEKGSRPNWEDVTTDCMHIADKPRFQWRGMHLDVSRHFYPPTFIKKYIDLLATFKMNVFHWHLIDDGGWRLEIKKYPKLTSIGSWREGNGKGWDYINLKFAENDGKNQVYGGFYSQADVKEIVAYAQERGVTIVPEIEMPGHALPGPWAYPEVGCTPNACEAWKKQTGMFGPNVYCAGKEKTFQFLNDVLDEVCDLFPSKFIHIGGDEVDKFLWNHCADCQTRMKTEGLKDAHELQSYFIKRIEQHLNARGKRLIGWDEILEGGLAPNASVMSWRGTDGGIAAAKAGHDVVMSPTSHCYFDYPYSSTSTQLVYSYEPIPDALTPEEGKRVLGAQGNVWTEWMDDSRRVEKMAYPRAAALAEVLWSPKAGRSWGEFQGRMRHAMARMDALDVRYELPVPEATLDACLFTDKATVSFQMPEVEGGEIRYTTDGTAPTEKSKLYTGPFDVTETTNIRAAVAKGKNLSTPIRVSYLKAQSTTATNNLTAAVHMGKFSTCAEMLKSSVAKTADAPDFGLGIAGVEDSFGISFTGSIRVPTAGVYTFTLSSDDGSMLSIGGAVVIDNDGLHGAVAKAGRVYLPAGRYQFQLDFFEAGGAQSLSVGVQPPGGTMAPLDSAWFATR
jgi:hexosaminidase